MIKEAKLVAIDTEFTREKTYYPILSLIQIAVQNSGKKKSFIIDCLSGIDLQPILQIMSDDQVTKILHSSLQDLQIFYQKNNAVPASIMDTQIMANFCGFGFNVGYSNLVENFCKIDIDKTLQRSDWQRRPLMQSQIDYALLDVLYLEEINHKLLEILEKNGRKDWYFEEIKNFIAKSIYQKEESLYKSFSLNKKSSGKKSAKQIAQIKKLILWRENCAKELDIPRQHFLKDEMIDRIVSEEYFDLSFDLRGMNADEIRRILASADECLVEEKNFFMSGKQKKLYEEAKKLIAKIAQEENLQEQFLITSSALKSIICDCETIDELVIGWRYQIFGKKLEQLIS